MMQRRRHLASRSRHSTRGGASAHAVVAGIDDVDDSYDMSLDSRIASSLEASTPTRNGLSSMSSSMNSSNTNSNNRNYVWVRTELVDAIWNNHGSLPRGWQPSRKRGRDAPSWGWMRAFVVQSSSRSTSPARSKSPYRPGSPFQSVTHKNNKNNQNLGKPNNSRATTTLVNITVDDPEFAPSHLRHATVSLSYDSNSNELVCDANTWWMKKNRTGGPPTPPNDLTSLTHLHEPSVVYCLHQRYEMDQIYTYTGKILLALNPFRMLDDRVYGENVMRQYYYPGVERPPPHVYAIAEDAYRSMLQSAGSSSGTKNNQQTQHQSILVSGESGSGKTVTTKIIMGYLATQSQRTSSTSTSSSMPAPPDRAENASSNDSKQSEGIESQILQSNPILESFGNARTVRNDNSSRFGKFMELLFTPSGCLVSASIETYLLEKVRLITQAPGERNYHIFYELLAGVPQTERQALRIGNVTALDFRMTALSGTFDRRDGVDDRQTYQDLLQALDTVGFSKEEQHEMMSVACALLHTSNIEFRDSDSADDGSEVVESPSLRNALTLFGVPVEALSNALCLCAIEARGETFYKNLSMPQATKALEALIKATYGALFSHIVSKINGSIGMQHNPDISFGELSRIGVLDIFGFESFDFNSFEQLCINYCNEALQQQFNRFVFKLEQQEYEREGIEWSFIEFPDNQDILDLIEKRREGILSILDEQSRLAACTDSTFCQAVFDKCKAHPRFSATNTQKANLEFAVDHYAGRVAYNCSNFLEKNKDELPKETTELLTSSSVPFLSYLGELLSESSAPSDPTTAAGMRSPSPTSSVSSYQSSTRPNGVSAMGRGGGGAPKKVLNRQSSSLRRESVGAQFSRQLRELRNRIDSTNPHYVRCLKPNDDLVPNHFEAQTIADQLRCAGVLEAIRVSRVGFPNRFVHDQFLERYSVLVDSKIKGGSRGKDLCVKLIKAVGPQVASVLDRHGETVGKVDKKKIVALGMQMGHSKVFLRGRVFDALEFLRNQKLTSAAIMIQKHTRRFVAQSHFADCVLAAITIQCFARKLGAMRNFFVLLEYDAATKIQSAWRRFFAETEFMAARLLAHFCQAYRRGAIARKLYGYLREEKKARTIQRFWRKYQSRREFVAIRRASVVVQCFWRQKAAKKRLKQLRLEAKDLNAVVAERDKFKEESLRLKKELERVKRGDGFHRASTNEEEVERLRMEVERLQMALNQNLSFQSVSTIEMPPDTVSVRSLSSRSLGRVWGRRVETSNHLSTYSSSPTQPTHIRVPRTGDTHASYESLPYDDSRATRTTPVSNLSREYGSPPSDDQGPTRITPVSNLSSEFSPVISPTSTSLLDIETHTEVADYQLHSIPDPNTSSPSRIFNMSTMSARSPDRSVFGFDPAPVSERRGLQFSSKLQQLHMAIEENDMRQVTDIVRSSVEPHVLINEADDHGRTALHVSVGASHMKVVRFLLENGAISNAQDFNGETPLHLSKSASMTKMLLETGKANPNIPNVDGVCVLHLAVQRMDAGSVRALLKHGAKVDAADNSRWYTALHVVSLPPQKNRAKHNEVVVRARPVIVDLLCNGTTSSTPDLNDQDIDGNTPLHYAVQIETTDACDVINTLLEKGANPQVANNRNQYPLLLLCHNEILRAADVFQECLHSMLFHGADPNKQSNTGCTPLHLSLYHKDVDSAVQLVNRAAELHLIWAKPKRWVADWDEMGSNEVLPLDMVQDEHSLHRILAAITRPPKRAPSRPWCMHCKSPMGSFARALHCGHCSRFICGSCSRCPLAPGFFPKSFDVFEPTWVCVVCERVLVARKEDLSSSTNPISSAGDDDYGDL